MKYFFILITITFAFQPKIFSQSLTLEDLTPFEMSGDTLHQLSEIVYRKGDVDCTDCVPISRTLYAYNPLGQKTEEVIQATGSGNQFFNQKRLNFEYNPNGDISQQITARWVFNQWDTTRVIKFESLYDSTGFLRITKSFKLEEDMWTSVDTIFFLYNNAGLLGRKKRVAVDKWYSENIRYEYDESERIVREFSWIMYNDGSESGDWEANDYVYNSGGLLTGKKYSKPNERIGIDSAFYDYRYNADGLLNEELYVYEDWYGTDLKFAKRFFLYDEHNNIHLIAHRWKKNKYDPWIPNNVYEYHYKTIVANEDDVSSALFSLSNYPNPFTGQTSINYTLTQAQNISLKVYDILGREVAVLVDKARPAGVNEVTFNAQNLPNGIYFCRISAGGATATQKIILAR